MSNGDECIVGEVEAWLDGKAGEGGEVAGIGAGGAVVGAHAAQGCEGSTERLLVSGWLQHAGRQGGDAGRVCVCPNIGGDEQATSQGCF